MYFYSGRHACRPPGRSAPSAALTRSRLFRHPFDKKILKQFSIVGAGFPFAAYPVPPERRAEDNNLALTGASLQDSDKRWRLSLNRSVDRQVVFENDPNAGFCDGARSQRSQCETIEETLNVPLACEAEFLLLRLVQSAERTDRRDAVQQEPVERAAAEWATTPNTVLSNVELGIRKLVAGFWGTSSPSSSSCAPIAGNAAAPQTTSIASTAARFARRKAP